MVRQFLQGSGSLLAINLRENQISKNKEYKVAVLECCSEITQIDEVMISPHIR
jgi:cellobiose-specific phosphotransferase system component IIB